MEAGHIIVEPGGLQCPCGARGCLEMYAHSRALLRAAGQLRHPGHEDTVTSTCHSAGRSRKSLRPAAEATACHSARRPVRPVMRPKSCDGIRQGLAQPPTNEVAVLGSRSMRRGCRRCRF
ncbi:ROK family protein [Actinomadura rudentiformis]|uniref:ROK family protein n=1 Tax=Actinomadura rudentiformis TaxID=359158 RepID=UPI001CEF7869|nr:ROK family protein [Actinomadura rudentiformis]